MKKTVFSWRQLGLASAVLLVGLATSGCVSTRKYTRERVDESSKELSGKIEQTDQKVDSNSSQISELGSVTRDHSQKIETLDSSIKQTDAKTQQAMAVGESAKSTAEKAVGEVSSLGTKFENRNNYVVLHEEKVKFKFNSAKLEKDYLPVLDDVAQQLKSNPDAILVMEGRTDPTGSADYNFQLGEKRLEAVIRYLVVDQGVPMHKVYRTSFGEQHPIVEGKDRQAKAENRAVIMRLMGPGDASSNTSDQVSQVQSDSR